MTNEFRKWMSNSFLERSVNDACVERSVTFIILHGGIALNSVRGKWEVVQSSYNKLTRPPIYP